MKWFGEPWPSEDLRAPVCEDDALRVPSPPPGELCGLCREAFLNGDRGVVMPHLTATGEALQGHVHLYCLLNNVGALP